MLHSSEQHDAFDWIAKDDCWIVFGSESSHPLCSATAAITLILLLSFTMLPKLLEDANSYCMRKLE